MAVTLQQIAEKAGVSRGTVDRAINHRGRINSEVAQRICEIAKEMGYQPNRAGRALAMSRRSIKIGVIIQSADTPFMQEVLDGVLEAKEEVEQLGAVVIVKKIKGIDASKVIAAMEKMKDLGCNGIALVPTEDELLKSVIERYMKEEQIQIITFNSDIEGAMRLCFIGQDTLQSGRAAAGLMGEILRENGMIQVISGHSSNQGHKNREKGFIEELSSCRPDICFLETKYAYDDDWVAEKITKDLLKESIELAGIYLTASGAEGVCKVIEESGLSGKVKVISNDLTTKNEEYLKNGTIQFLLGQDGHTQGYKPIMTLFHKLFDGIEPLREHDYTEIVIKNKYNI